MTFIPDDAPMADATPLTFTATGSEYFRIWIVNLFLSILTLGIYSAWAKVRTLRYLYRNTQLDGHGFDYHGNPLSILKGRIIVFVLVVVAQLLEGFLPLLSLAMSALFIAVLPWLVMRSLSFRMAYTSHRGLRFGFDGRLAGAYRTLLLWPVLALVSCGLLAPIAYQRFKQYQHEHTRYGSTPFHIRLRTGSVYGLMFAVIGMLIVTGVIVATLTSILLDGGNLEMPAVSSLLMIALPAYAGIFVIDAFMVASLQNLVWSGTTLGDDALRFRSDVRTLPLLAILVTNLLGMIVTLGLFYPFARIRLLRYRLQHVSVAASVPLDSFVAGQPQEVSALGDAMTDWYDIDISL